VIAAGHDGARHGNAFAQYAALHFADGELAGVHLLLAELHDEFIVFFLARPFAARREGKCRAEHEHSREQPNPDHCQYPVTSLDRS